MIRKFCDRCGKETETALMKIRAVLVTDEPFYPAEILEGDGMDLCDDCVKEIRAFSQTKKKA